MKTIISKCFLISILVIFFSVISFSQTGEGNSPTFKKEYNDLLDEYEKEIKILNSLLTKSRNKANKLLKNNEIKEKQLEKAIRDFQYAQAKIKDWEEKFSSLESKYKNQLKENNNDLAGLKNVISKLRLSLSIEREHRKQLEKELKDKDLQDLFNRADLQAKSDALYRSDELIIGKKVKPILFFTVGYKNDFNDLGGPDLKFVPGVIVSNFDNIFLGIGTGYEHYNELNFDGGIESSYSFIPIFLSSMFAIDGKFIPKKSMLSDSDQEKSLYALFDLGIAKSISSDVKGGFFSNLGVGGMLDIGENLEANGILSWRRQKVEITEKSTFFNTISLSIGLRIYLN